MTEADWLACQDPVRMLEYVRWHWHGSERQGRCFGAACARRAWDLLADDRSRQAIETAERRAEGRVTEPELREARRRAYAVVEEVATTPAISSCREASSAADMLCMP